MKLISSSSTPSPMVHGPNPSPMSELKSTTCITLAPDACDLMRATLNSCHPLGKIYYQIGYLLKIRWLVVRSSYVTIPASGSLFRCHRRDRANLSGGDSFEYFPIRG